MSTSIALVYVRQSRHKEGERTASPQVQEEQCRALPAVAACDRIEVLSDLDRSGGKLKGRKEFADLIERIERDSVSVVAAYDQSRAFRNTTDALAFYALMERHPKVEVVFVQGRFDRSPVGGFTYTTLAASHEMERRMTAEKIRDAYGYRNAQGAATGPVPFGYLRVASRAEGRVEIDLETAPIVRRIFEDYATGAFSVKSLAKRLNAEGVRTAREREWLPDSIAQMLGNVVYAGKTYSASRRRREGAIIKAQWPELVSEQLFEAVQLRLRRNHHVGPGHSNAHHFAFSRLLICTSCGRPMRSTYDHERCFYYCRKDLVELCPAPWVREEKILPWAEELFEGLDRIRPADLRKALADAGRQRQSPEALANLESTLERNRKLFSWGHIAEEEYLAENARLEELRAELEISTAPAPTIRLDGLLATWRTGDPIARRELLVTLFEKLHVEDGRIVGYTPREDRAAEVIELLAAAAAASEVPAKSGAGGVQLTKTAYTEARVAWRSRS